MTKKKQHRKYAAKTGFSRLWSLEAVLEWKNDIIAFCKNIFKWLKHKNENNINKWNKESWNIQTNDIWGQVFSNGKDSLMGIKPTETYYLRALLYLCESVMITELEIP